MWRSLSCGNISPHDRFLHMSNEKCGANLFSGEILHMTLFCRNLRCFVAKSVLLRFTRFCVETNWTKNCACGEKTTNIRYAYAEAKSGSTDLHRRDIIRLLVCDIFMVACKVFDTLASDIFFWTEWHYLITGVWLFFWDCSAAVWYIWHSMISWPSVPDRNHLMCNVEDGMLKRCNSSVDFVTKEWSMWQQW